MLELLQSDMETDTEVANEPAAEPMGGEEPMTDALKRRWKIGRNKVTSKINQFLINFSSV